MPYRLLPCAGGVDLIERQRDLAQLPSHVLARRNRGLLAVFSQARVRETDGEPGPVAQPNPRDVARDLRRPNLPVVSELREQPPVARQLNTAGHHRLVRGQLPLLPRHTPIACAAQFRVDPHQETRIAFRRRGEYRPVGLLGVLGAPFLAEQPIAHRPARNGRRRRPCGNGRRRSRRRSVGGPARATAISWLQAAEAIGGVPSRGAAFGECRHGFRQQACQALVEVALNKLRPCTRNRFPRLALIEPRVEIFTGEIGGLPRLGVRVRQIPFQSGGRLVERLRFDVEGAHEAFRLRARALRGIEEAPVDAVREQGRRRSRVEGMLAELPVAIGAAALLQRVLGRLQFDDSTGGCGWRHLAPSRCAASRSSVSASIRHRPDPGRIRPSPGRGGWVERSAYGQPSRWDTHSARPPAESGREP